MKKLSNFLIHSIFKLSRMFKCTVFVALTIAAIFLVYAKSEEVTAPASEQTMNVVSTDNLASAENIEHDESIRLNEIEERNTNISTSKLYRFSDTIMLYSSQNSTSAALFQKSPKYYIDVEKNVQEEPASETLQETQAVETEKPVESPKPTQSENPAPAAPTEPSASENTTSSSSSSVQEAPAPQPDPVPENSNVITTSSGETLRYKQVLDMRATAYTYSYNGLDITASGAPVQVGIVSADFSVIPMNSRVYIVAADGSWEYGLAVVGDTGVSGNTIDLFFETKDECIIFGVKNAIVYVLE